MLDSFDLALVNLRDWTDAERGRAIKFYYAPESAADEWRETEQS